MQRVQHFLVVILALAAALVVITSATAQTQKPKTQHHHYQLVQIPTLGGPETAFVDAVNNIGVVNAQGSVSGGTANTTLSDPYSPNYWWTPTGLITHAYLWQNDTLTDLGSLPGTNNSASTWITDNGNIVGYSENGQIDPSVPDLPEISAVAWLNGGIVNLGALGGGYQSAAMSINNDGAVTGIATNLVPDANSLLQYNLTLWDLPYPYQLRAFVWDQKNGIQDLGTLGTGTDAQSVRINDHGQIIGDSYLSTAPGACFGTETGAFIWDRTSGMVNLGSFGGSCTLANDLNNQGQVVGGSMVRGDRYMRAFLWQKGSLRRLGGSLGGHNTGALAINEKGSAAGFAYLHGETAYHPTLWTSVRDMADLGTIDGDPCAFAQGINDRNQVVGDSLPSCDNSDVSRGFLWENGSMADLNALVPPDSPLYIIYAYTINQKGEIAINGIDANSVEQAALLVPCDEAHPAISGCDYSMAKSFPSITPPEAARRASLSARFSSSLGRLSRSYFPAFGPRN
jgi:probable HAF family extracellular repeat protein